MQASVSCHREALLQQLDAIVQPGHTINSNLARPGLNFRFLLITLPLLEIAILIHQQDKPGRTTPACWYLCE